MTDNRESFGKDHYSLLAYFETVAVDKKGIVDLIRLRVNSKKRGFRNGTSFGWKPEYGTKWKGMVIRDGDHDDIDVMSDLEYAGWVKNMGTDINPVISLTKEGRQVVALVRQHKMDGGSFANFVLPQELIG